MVSRWTVRVSTCLEPRILAPWLPALCTIVVVVAAIEPTALLAQTWQPIGGEIRGQIDVHSNSDNSLAVVTLDLAVEDKVDGKRDWAFIIVRPERNITFPSGPGIIRLSSETREVSYAFIELVADSKRARVLIDVPEGSGTRPQAGEASRVQAKRIFLGRVLRDTLSPSEIAENMFKSMMWEGMTEKFPPR